jgi:universal stress protein E
MYQDIIAVIESQTDAPYVLEKVRALAADATNVHVVRVIYEGLAEIKSQHIDQSHELKSLMLEAMEKDLVDILEAHGQNIANLDSKTLWNRCTWEGVLHEADAVGADLIVKASHWEGSIQAIGRTPDDWNLLRHANVPVLLLKDSAWSQEGCVLAAVDAFDDDSQQLAATVLRTAAGLAALIGDQPLQVVSTYPLFEPWVGELGDTGSYANLQDNIVKDIKQQVASIADQAEVGRYQLLAEEGPTVHAIKMTAESTHADLLVVGTHAREGIRGVVLGNTAEKLLHGVDVDVLVVR